MTNVIIIILLLVLIFKEEIKTAFKKPAEPEKIDKEEEKKQREFREQFEKLMAYSINDAIESKRDN